MVFSRLILRHSGSGQIEEFRKKGDIKERNLRKEYNSNGEGRKGEAVRNCDKKEERKMIRKGRRK